MSAAGGVVLRTYTIYDHPADYPHGFVMRIWVVTAAGPEPDAAVYVNSLEQARMLIPPGKVRIAASQADDPCVVETWL